MAICVVLVCMCVCVRVSEQECVCVCVCVRARALMSENQCQHSCVWDVLASARRVCVRTLDANNI